MIEANPPLNTVSDSPCSPSHAAKRGNEGSIATSRSTTAIASLNEACTRSNSIRRLFRSPIRPASTSSSMRRHAFPVKTVRRCWSESTVVTVPSKSVNTARSLSEQWATARRLSGASGSRREAEGVLNAVR
jgi:hypothetical protein